MNNLLIMNVKPVADGVIDDRTSIPVDAIINISECSMLAPIVNTTAAIHAINVFDVIILYISL